MVHITHVGTLAPWITNDTLAAVRSDCVATPVNLFIHPCVRQFYARYTVYLVRVCVVHTLFKCPLWGSHFYNQWKIHEMK